METKQGTLTILLGTGSNEANIRALIAEADRQKSTGKDMLFNGSQLPPANAAAMVNMGISYVSSSDSGFSIENIINRNPGIVILDRIGKSGENAAPVYQQVIALLARGISVIAAVDIFEIDGWNEEYNTLFQWTNTPHIPKSFILGADAIFPVAFLPESENNQSKQSVEEHTALQAIIQGFLLEYQEYHNKQTGTVRQPSPANTKDLVIIAAVSENSSATAMLQQVIHFAAASNAVITVVHINTGKPYTDKQKQILQQNLQFAQETGLKVVISNDAQVRTGITRIAKELGATHIFIGSGGTIKFSWLHSSDSLNTALLTSLTPCTIVTVPDLEQTQQYDRLNFFRISSGKEKFIIACLMVLATALLCYPVRDHIGYQSVALILLLQITLLPLLRLGTGPIISATLLSAFIWDYFFIPPHFTLTIGRLEDSLMLLLYVIVTMVTSILSGRYITQERMVRERESKTNALFQLSFELSQARGIENIIKAALRNIEKSFAVQACIVLAEQGKLQNTAHPASSIILDQFEMTFAYWAFAKREKAGRFTNTLPASEVTHFPMISNNTVVAVLGITPQNGQPLSYEQEMLLNTCINLIALAIEKENLNEKAAQSILLSESEKLYKNIFNSLSHEFRTPITTILSATASIEDPNIAKDTALIASLFGEIRIAATRLNNLVQNLLDMARLDSGMLKPKLGWHDITDLLNALVEKCKDEFQRPSIILSCKDEIPVFQFDHTFVEQAVLNIIRNAAMYTAPETRITVEVQTEEQNCVITVTDEGPGIAEPELKRIFQKFFRGNQSKTGGMGLGLSIAKGFIEAHGGSIQAAAGLERGLQMKIYLPLLIEDGNERPYTHH